MKKKMLIIVVMIIVLFLAFNIVRNKGKRSVELNEIVNNEFENQTQVEILDYNGHAMEPFISKDGEYLFFNNENHPKTNTNLHYATRMGENSFQYQGEVKGINTEELEGVATMDEENNFYYMSTLGLTQTLSTVHVGKFNNGEVSDVNKVLVNAEFGGIVMGPSISSDGNTLYFVIARHKDNKPISMNIYLANKKGDNFVKNTNSEDIMKNINTEHLDYAPEISNNGLELYFTRASGFYQDASLAGGKFETFVAKRNSINEPFGIPEKIDIITGYSEGPTLPKDGKTLYFHKKIDGKFQIVKILRK